MTTVRQLSIFLENKSGTMIKVLQVLKDNGIQIIASTVADTAEYGIYRVICDAPEKAYDVLRASGVAVSLCEVRKIEIDDTPGAAADVISAFAAEGVSILYMYSFLLDGRGVLIIKTDK